VIRVSVWENSGQLLNSTETLRFFLVAALAAVAALAVKAAGGASTKGNEREARNGRVGARRQGDLERPAGTGK
jgi:hypothetical protein